MKGLRVVGDVREFRDYLLSYRNCSVNQLVSQAISDVSMSRMRLFQFYLTWPS